MPETETAERRGRRSGPGFERRALGIFHGHQCIDANVGTWLAALDEVLSKVVWVGLGINVSESTAIAGFLARAKGLSEAILSKSTNWRSHQRDNSWCTERTRRVAVRPFGRSCTRSFAPPAAMRQRFSQLGKSTMLDGVMLLWFVLTALALLFVTIDIRSTPESPVLKWGFLLLTAYIGVVGAFLYVLGCREPLAGLHERYVAVRWRQTLGSTMHCVAGDGVGILAGAVLSSVLALSGLTEVILEYILWFAFGWTIFQSLFMRDTAGGSYQRALGATFIPELLSMNLLMAGMVPTVMILRAQISSASDPTVPSLWFIMSMGLLVGFIVAYPMNWWLVANDLKHGMMTVRPLSATAGAQKHSGHAAMDGSPQGGSFMTMGSAEAPQPPVPVMTLLSFLALGLGLAIAFLFRPL